MRHWKIRVGAQSNHSAEQFRAKHPEAQRAKTAENQQGEQDMKTGLKMIGAALPAAASIHSYANAETVLRLDEAPIA